MATYARRGLLLPLGLTWLALTLRLYRLAYQSLWRDEVDTLRFATRGLSELLATFRKPGENGPLFFLGMRPWLAVAGQSEFALRFPSALAGALAVPATYVVVHRLAGRYVALVAALLMATAPYLVWYGQEAKMYAALTVLAPLSLWLTLAAAQRGGWWRWGLLYVVTSLSFYTHVLAVLVVPVQALWLLILPAGSGKMRRWLATATYLAVLILPYLPLLWWQARLWLSPTFQTGHPYVPLAGISKILVVAFSQGVLPMSTPVALLPVMLALLAGIGLWTATRAKSEQSVPASAATGDPAGSWRPVLLLVIWLALPVLAVYGVSLGMPVFADRYLIWVMPAFVALLALGIVALSRVWQPLGWATLSILVILNLVGVRAQASQSIKSDFRAAAQFVTAHRQPDDLLIYQIPYIRYAFTYYLARQAGSTAVLDDASVPGLAWLDGPYTNGGMNASALAKQMGRGTAQTRSAWLIASEAPMWDARGLTQTWLATHGVVTDHADFARVSVTRYELER
jgi:mannosyltransferase